MKTIRAEELPEDLTALEFLRSLDPSEEILIETDGRPRVVILSLKSVEQRKAAQARLFHLIDDIRARHPDADSDEVLKDLEAAG
jgi:hypothetical protein